MNNEQKFQSYSVKGNSTYKRTFIDVLLSMGFTPLDRDFSVDYILKRSADIKFSSGPGNDFHLRKDQFTGSTKESGNEVIFTLPQDMIAAIEAAKSAIGFSVKQGTTSIEKTPIRFTTVEHTTIAGSKYKVGDRVSITQIDLTYSTYSQIFEKLGFNNTSKNFSDRAMLLEVAEVFGMSYHSMHNNTVLLALRFNDGRELLIDQEGVEAFTGFKANDLVVVQSSDPYYCSLPSEDRDKAVAVGQDEQVNRLSSSFTRKRHCKFWINIKFSNGSTNCYHHVRYASIEEIAEWKSKQAVTVAVGSGLTAKQVSITSMGVTLVDDGVTVTYISPKQVKQLVENIKSLQVGAWKVTPTAIQIGCVKGVTLEQLEKVVEASKKFGLID